MTTLKRPQTQPDPNEAYMPVRGGINAYTKSLNETTDTPIGDFYKERKVTQALKQVEVKGYTKYRKHPDIVDIQIITDDKGNKLITPKTIKATVPNPDELIDYEDIKKKLIAHPKEVKEYYRGLMTSSVYLTKTVYYTVPPNNSPEFDAMASCFRAERVEIPPEYGRGGAVMAKINLKKKDKLISLIKEQPQKTGYTLNVLYEANPDADTDLALTPRTDDQVGYITSAIPLKKVERYTLLLDLVEKCDITPEGMTRQTLTTNGKERGLTDTHAIAERILTDALVSMLEDYASKELEKRSVVNVRNPDSHAIMGQPTAINFTDMLVKNAQEQIDTLLKPYRTIEELKADNGIDMYLDDKQTLPIFDLKTDAKTRARAIRYYVALQTRSLVAFDEWKKEHPDEKSVTISDLAKYTSWAREVTSGKGLKPEHRNALVKGLEIAGHLSHKYIVGKSRYKGKDGKWHVAYERKYIYLLTRLKGDKIDPKTGRVISVEVDFDPEYKRALNLNLGVVLDNLDKVKTETAIVIGLYLCQRMVANQTAVAEKNKPIRTRVSTLIKVASIFDTNATQRCNTIKRSLEELEQANVIGKWQALKDGEPNGKLIVVDKHGDASLDIWAKDPSVYITGNQNRRLKASKAVYQKEWLTALKRLHDPNKAYTDPKTLAKDLEITKEQLDLYLGGEAIPDEVGERIIALKEEMGL